MIERRAAWIELVVVFVATAAAAAIGAVGSVAAGPFYAELQKPAWAPPAGVFGPVWTVLYALMALAAWLVWREAGRRAVPAIVLYGVQLVLNALWPWIFFSWNKGVLSLVEILVLWAAIAATVYLFDRIKSVAALLLLPYLAWVTFAAALTGKLLRLNADFR